ncbi:LINE-1 reverse transcriptase-like [Symbiodinium microadriaticum]|uniref:LINE-1 reverse transcriptase-like n=1 Tax=Symbiodinium microadriaticum TaxID=2951 RepID=A0A1Q9CDJ3_SYMMI|nr:LINE-1 reverse transcriptase-like [Symbiodinium microadriaticum]
MFDHEASKQVTVYNVGSSPGTLKNPIHANRFAAIFEDEMQHVSSGNLSIDALYADMTKAFYTAAQRCVPASCFKPARPWISDHTLSLLEARDRSRSINDRIMERAYTLDIKQSVKQDRTRWLDGLLSNGNWDEIRKLRRNSKSNHLRGRLRDMQGNTVDSDQRAETLAEYFAKVQWAVRPVTCAIRHEPLGDPLPVDVGTFSAGEVARAGKQLKRNKASGVDEVPAEFWKAVCSEHAPACKYVVELCNCVWASGHVPKAWHEATIRAIFKKGDPLSCENSRPISLISAAYKLFAVALLNRLKNAGAESRLSSTQFGFRSQRGSSDAILIARRLLEDAWSRKDSSLILMALDWAKAFDSISPTSLAMALERFGVPPSFINIVASIYSDRKFTVRDCGCTSNKYDQHHGISQGCPLSPFLFSIMMTVLIADASYAVKNTLSNHLPKAIVNELMYADDTLLVAMDSDFAATHMRDIERCGSQYGLSFNWRKVEI